MKKYDCFDLIDFILARQIQQARRLVQSENLWPKVAIFGEVSDDFRADLNEYFANFYDVAKKRNLISAEFFAKNDEENFAKINNEKNAEFQGIFAKNTKKASEKFANLAGEISRKKDIFGLRENSDFDSPEILAEKYFVAGFDAPEDFFAENSGQNMEEKSEKNTETFAKIPENVENFAALEIAALTDNLLRTCAENF